MRWISNNWPRIALLYLPLFIITVDAAVLISDRFQTETEKAIRLVRESTSRKENFTVQQYLYSTVYNRRSNGDPVEIEGWRASEPSGPDMPITVEFSYTDAGGRHTALWGANLREGKVTPQNDAASDLSWH
ncbi:MAG TPA: hypothetical protein VNI02_14360 [Blastocatellia bacterium]|jgi:hypothetical protein|nr:hypothetical protein [Blastocatellia bacterium]